MGYSEAVKRKITGEGNELGRRKEIWDKIDNVYERGGEDAIKSILIKRSDSLTEEFDKLLKQLREKL